MREKERQHVEMWIVDNLGLVQQKTLFFSPKIRLGFELPTRLVFVAVQLPTSVSVAVAFLRYS
jgi:hypothetical protein